MKLYEEVSFEILIVRVEDIITSSPGGIEFGKDSNDNDLGWGE